MRVKPKFSIYNEFYLIEFNHVARKYSSAPYRGGIGTSQGYLNMHVENNYNFDIYEYVKSFLTKNNLSSELTVNMTSVDIQKYQMENVSVGNYFVQATITAGFDNAISIGNKYGKPGTINMCVITDYPLTDSGAINLYQTCIEAKVQALNDMNIRDIMTGIVSPGTSTDTLSIFVINREKKYDYAGRLTEIGYETSLLVYNNLIKFGELR